MLRQERDLTGVPKARIASEKQRITVNGFREELFCFL